MNKKGMVLYSFLLLFLLINFAVSSLIMDFFLTVKEEKLHLEKEGSRLMAENAFEEGLALIYQGQEEGYYFLNDESYLKIIKLLDNNYLLECQAQKNQALSKAEARVKIDEEGGLVISEKKIY